MSTIQADRTHPAVPLGVKVTRDGGITGLTVVLRIFNGANLSQFLDFNDGTFKDAAHTSPTLALTEEQAATNPGYYSVDGGFDLSAITIPAAAESLHAQYEITAGGETGEAIDVIEFFDRPVDLIWDELNRGADHNIKDSTGKQQRQASGGGFDIETEDVVAATATTIELQPTESAVDGFLTHREIIIAAGPGAGQARVILAWDGTTKIATVSRAWDTNPTNASEYVLWGSTESRPVPLDVRDSQKLAPSAGAPAGGSVDQHLDDLLTNVAAVETEAAAAAREATNTAEHGTTLTAVGLVETEAAASSRAATNTAEHAATLAAVLLTETEASAAARHAAILAILTSTGVVLTGPAITAIWDEDVTGREASPNTAARIQDMKNKLMRGRLRTNPAANQLELYDPVDDTVLLTWPLTDFGGNPIANAIGAPFDRAKAVET